MRIVTGWLGLWARSIDERALSNARSAATACSRQRLERAEVEEFLERHLAAATAATAVGGGVETGAVVHTSTAAQRRARAVH